MRDTHKSIYDTVKKAESKIAKIDQYQIYTLEHDTIIADTSLTIQKLYKQNYLRKDTFGLLPFANIGQTYNTLNYGLTSFDPYPEFGFKAKHFNFLEANQIQYYKVATPFTELFFNTSIGKGQNVDSFLTLNTSENLNFSIAYRGLRSEGKYINSLTSTGNFRFTASYQTKNKRYILNYHMTYQDILNEENGGITTPENFESDDPDYNNRQRLQVYLTDARSFLKGRRFFIDHAFRVNRESANNNLFVTHQFNYENKDFEYTQPTVVSTVGTTQVLRFGEPYVYSNINDQTHFNKLYNKFGLAYENVLLGKFYFYVDDFRSNYYYNRVIINTDPVTGVQDIIPSNMSQNINNLGGQYEYQKDRWKGRFLYSRSITNQSLSNLDAFVNYHVNDKIQLEAQYQNINKLPNFNYNLFQSSFLEYNWSNNFKNEKINSLQVSVLNPWLSLSAQYTILNDHLYFFDAATDEEKANYTQIIKPAQYNNAINYLSVKAAKEFVLGHFALDNNVLYQNVQQTDLVLNVPEFVTRNTFYYTNYLFKKALYLQTGITFNYFTSYFGNNYNPVLGEFFVQQDKKIGNYTNFDFFINARIRQTRLFFKIEHFDAALGANNYYSAPDNPYRDLTIRFGLVWNFFQ
ncbi:putative porin [Flavobacterium agrisoli]|nr:putative porin [Flavobacterium agrisoli]